MTDKDTNKENGNGEIETGAERSPEPQTRGRGFRRALAMVALVGAVAVALSYWSRREEVTITLVVQAAHGGAKMKKAQVLLVDSEGNDRVRVSLSELNDVDAPHRRKVEVKKGAYSLKTIVTHTDGTRKRTEKKIQVDEDLTLRVNLR